jgi:adenosylmethionine-8-amino-7-oxononanoate aminotransferase
MNRARVAAIGCAVVIIIFILAVQQTIEARDLLTRVNVLGEGLKARLNERFAHHAHVGDIRGRGLFQGLELVADRDSRKPFDASLKLHARLKKAAMAEGLMCYPMGGTLDGRQGDHILLAPPFILQESHLDEITTKLGRAIDTTLASL